MDIALISMALNQGQIKQQASLSIMKMSMERAQVTSQGLTEMMSSIDVAAMQHSVQPHLGGYIDINV